MEFRNLHFLNYVLYSILATILGFILVVLELIVLIIPIHFIDNENKTYTKYFYTYLKVKFL